MKTIPMLSITVLVAGTLFAQEPARRPSRPWKGSAILGNGQVCVVYSDDDRISTQTRHKGIQHFYFDDYTADYVASTAYELEGERSGPAVVRDSVGRASFFATSTRTLLPGRIMKEVRCFVHPRGAAVISLHVKGLTKPAACSYTTRFRKRIVTDRTTTLISLSTQGSVALAEWSNGVIVAAGTKRGQVNIDVSDSTVTIHGKVQVSTPTEVILVPARSVSEALATVRALRSLHDLYDTAARHWETWMTKGRLPFSGTDALRNRLYQDFFKQNLYAAYSASIRGQIPADITGQFTTNAMPQLYPRDAMMCARVFLLTGHYDAARTVIEFWLRSDIPRKSPGEFYARYDAYAKAVDAGSGARYDEPEWDSNGYLIQLLNDYHEKTGVWLADRAFLYELADFLVRRIDHWGLLYEGGIVEWTGYLPATNMICAAALGTAARVARDARDSLRAEIYANASEKISSSLHWMFDRKRMAYTAVRFHGIKAEDNRSISSPAADTLYLWDTSVNFGVLWGYPDHLELVRTNEFLEQNTVILGGGVQYFEAKDNAGLSAYGNDAFFFTTAAAAQYYARGGKPEPAKKHIDWMIRNANVYGLMPERIYRDESDCSPASPLSWCCGEFAAAVLAWSRIK